MYCVVVLGYLGLLCGTVLGDGVLTVLSGNRGPNVFLSNDCSTVIRYTNANVTNTEDFAYCITFDTKGVYVDAGKSVPKNFYRNVTISTYAKMKIPDFNFQRLPKRVYYNETYNGAMSLYMPGNKPENVVYEQCAAVSDAVSGVGLTHMDCCMDSRFDTCMYYVTNDTRFLPLSANRCVATYQGYGTPLGTPCETYYATESPFYTAKLPDGDVYTNFGATNHREGHSCYLEGWSQKMINGEFRQGLDNCDVIYYAYYTYGLDRLDRDTDVIYIDQIVSQGYKVFLVVGGYYVQEDKVRAFWGDQFDAGLAFLMTFVEEHNLEGLMIDVQWPGKGKYVQVSKPLLLARMDIMCAELHRKTKQCHMQVSAIPENEDPEYYAVLGAADRVAVAMYDMAGCWNATSANDQSQIRKNTTIPYSLERTLDALEGFIPARKISVILPLFVRGYSVAIDNGDAGCFPSAGESGTGSAGEDVLVERNGDIEPKFCSQDLMSSVEPNPTNPHAFLCEGRASMDWRSVNYKIPYFVYDTLVYVRNFLYTDYGITDYGVFAHTMAPEVSFGIASIMRSHGRPKRAVGPSYAFPSGKGTGVVICPGIVYFSPSIIATTLQYRGCIKPDGVYCYYSTKTFDCVLGGDYIRPERSHEICQGVDVTLLLPAREASTRIMCNDMTLYIEEVTICGRDAMTLDTVESAIIPADLQSDFQWYATEIYGEPRLSYSVLRLPAICQDFVRPLTCMEFVCRDQADCMAEFRSSPYFAVCQPIGDALNEYSFLLDEVVRSHDLMIDIKKKLLDQAQRYHMSGQPTRQKRWVGLLIGGLFSFAAGMMMGGGSKDYAGDIKTLGHNIEETNKRIDRIEKFVAESVEQQNEMRKNLAKFTADVSKRFQAVEVALNDMMREQKEFQSRVEFKFERIDRAIIELGKTIAAQDKKLELYAKISAATTAYTAHVITLLARLSTFGGKIRRLTQELAVCYSSLVAGTFDGCTSEQGKVQALSVLKGLDNGTGDGVVVFLYLIRDVVDRQAYRATNTYCNQGKMYVAAQGCTFVQKDDEVLHLTNSLSDCTAPYAEYRYNCTEFTVRIQGEARPKGQVIKEGFLDINQTGELSDLVGKIVQDNVQLVRSNFTWESLNFSGLTDESALSLQRVINSTFVPYRPDFWTVSGSGGSVLSMVALGLVFLGFVVVFSLIVHQHQLIEQLRLTNPKKSV